MGEDPAVVEFQPDLSYSFDFAATEDRRGVLRIPPFLLINALHIPDGAEIIGAEWDFSAQQIYLHVRHPDLSQVPQHVPAPLVNVMITQEYHEDGPHYTYTSEWA